jgi:hypothetical protein
MEGFVSTMGWLKATLSPPKPILKHIFREPLDLSGPILSVFFCGGPFKTPSPRIRHFLSDGFWRGAVLNYRCPRNPPQVYRQRPLHALRRRSSTPRRNPLNPRKPIFPARCSIRISEFSQIPQNRKRPSRGYEQQAGKWVFWGFRVNSKPQPHRRVGINGSPGGQSHRGPIYMAILKLSFANLRPGWGEQNRMNGGDGKSVNREQRWVDFLIDFQR